MSSALAARLTKVAGGMGLSAAEVIRCATDLERRLAALLADGHGEGEDQALPAAF